MKMMYTVKDFQEASILRHMYAVVLDLPDAVIEVRDAVIELIRALVVIVVWGAVFLLFPISIPLVAFIRRRIWRKMPSAKKER